MGIEIGRECQAAVQRGPVDEARKGDVFRLDPVEARELGNRRSSDLAFAPIGAERGEQKLGRRAVTRERHCGVPL